MDRYTQSGKKRKRLKRRPAIVLQPREKQIRVEGLSLKDFFKNSLRAMGHLLNPGSCSSAHHYDSFMSIEVSATDRCTLLVDFLNKVLKLTHMHHAIFCAMYIDESTETKLVAQLYGTWFKDYDRDIKSVIKQKCTIEKNEDSSFSGLIVFELI